MTQPRPEIIDAGFAAMYTLDRDKIQQFLHMVAEAGITQSERERIDDLMVAAIIASGDHQDRVLEVLNVLVHRQWDHRPTWEELFDDLLPEGPAQLRDLYEALPDPARLEYDRRYGRPPDLAEERP